MIIHIFDKAYRMRPHTSRIAKTAVKKALEKARDFSAEKADPEYYTAFVIMMYVVSASILKLTTAKELLSIVELIDEKELKGIAIDKSTLEKEKKKPDRNDKQPLVYNQEAKYEEEYLNLD